MAEEEQWTFEQEDAEKTEKGAPVSKPAYDGNFAIPAWARMKIEINHSLFAEKQVSTRELAENCRESSRL